MCFFNKLDSVLTLVEKYLICFTLIIMLGTATLQVILRNFFDTGIGWADVFVRHMVLFILFFGASLSTKQRRHIQMDATAKIIPDALKPYLSMLVNLFCVATCYFLFKSSYSFVSTEKLFGEILFAKIPTWYFISIMPIGFATITFRFFLNALDDLLVLCGAKKPAQEEGHATPIEV